MRNSPSDSVVLQEAAGSITEMENGCMNTLEGLPQLSVGPTHGPTPSPDFGPEWGARYGQIPQAIWQVASFLDDLRDPLVVIDEFGRMCFVNRAFERFIGQSRSSLLGLDVSAVIETQVVDLTVGPRALSEPSFPLSRHTESGVATHPGKALFRRAGVGLAEVPVRWGDIASLDPIAVGVRYLLVVEPRPVVEAVLSRLDELRLLHHELAALLHENSDAMPPIAQGLAAIAVEGHTAIRAELSKREREILGLVADGKRVGTIATLLFLSENTVRNHLKRMYRKLDVSSLGELREHVVVSSLRRP
jgi:DNA-binding CsgD family transcriptional regulator